MYLIVMFTDKQQYPTSYIEIYRETISISPL